MIDVNQKPEDWRARPFPEEAQKRAIAYAEKLVESLQPIYEFLSGVAAPDLSENLTEQEIKILSSRYPLLFAKRYFFKNVVKCAVASSLYGANFRNTRRIIDLGTGPGTFLFSFSSLFMNNEFTGLDQSEGALEIASELFSLIRARQPLLLKARLPGAIVGGGRFFTASYLLAELEPGERLDFAALMTRRVDAQFLIVDYPRVTYEFASTLRGFRDCHASVLNLSLPAELAKKVGDDKISFGAIYAPIVASPARAISRKLATAQHYGFDRIIR